MARTNGQMLEERLREVLAVGEGPYRDNRRAVEIIDVYGNAEEGAAKLREVLVGMGAMVSGLEVFRDAANAVSRKALSVVR